MIRSRKPALLLAEDIAFAQEDQKRSEGARACAAALARRLKAPIHVVHVDDLSLYPAQAPQYRTLFEQHIENQKSRLASAAKSMNFPAKSVFLQGHPAHGIVSLGSRKSAYEMIVVGTRGRTGLKRFLLGSVAEEIVRNAKIPVLTVGPSAQKGSEAFLAGNELTVLVPTGLTPNSNSAEHYAASLAARLGAKLVLFHCLREGLHPVMQNILASPEAGAGLDWVIRELREATERRLGTKARALAKLGVPVSFVLDDRTLAAADAILKAAPKCKASMIVMGTHGRSLLKGAFFGRTARDVLLGSTVPVVTFRSKRP